MSFVNFFKKRGGFDDWNFIKDLINELYELKSNNDPIRINNNILICKLVNQTLHLEYINKTVEDNGFPKLSDSILKYCKDKEFRNCIIKLMSFIETDTLQFDYKLTVLDFTSYFIDIFLKSSSDYEILIGREIELKFRSMNNKNRIFFINHVKLNRVFIFDYLLINMYESCLKGSQDRLKRTALKQKRDVNKLYDVYLNRRPLIQSNAYKKLNWTTCLMLILSLITEFIDNITEKSKYEPLIVVCIFSEFKIIMLI